MRIYIYIYIHTYIHTYIRTRIYIYIHRYGNRLAIDWTCKLVLVDSQAACPLSVYHRHQGQLQVGNYKVGSPT